MKKFKPKHTFSKGKSDRDRSGGRDSFRSRDDRFSRREPAQFERTMHSVRCSACGKRCEVPFRPTEGKPVYCDACFRTSSKDDHAHSSSKDELAQINRKLDKIMQALDVD